VAAQIKGRSTSREVSETGSLASKKVDNDDAFQSCKDDSSHGGDAGIEAETLVSQGGNTVANAEIDNSVVTVNRTWWGPPKCTALLQPRANDPLAKAEKLALTLRSSKRSEILRSKRNRGES
jgi:hypothetical protein